MTKTQALIGSALIAATAAGMVSACGMEPEVPNGGLQDYSNKSAPKVIQSKDITAFAYTFMNFGRIQTVKSRGGQYIGVSGDGSYSGRCALKLTRQGEKADFSVSCSGDGQGTPFKASGTVGKEALDDLQAIIDKYKVARLNGFYRRNSALGNYFDLRINYASGEAITAGGEGGISVLPEGGLPDETLKALFTKLVLQTGQAIPSIIPPSDTINYFKISFVNNHAEAGFPAGRYLLQYVHIQNREYAYASLEPAGTTEKRVFKTDLSKDELKALQSLVDQEKLPGLYGYTNRKPELGDQKLSVEVAYQNRRMFRIEAQGDESVLPAAYWTDGKPYVEFFRQAAQKRGKAFP